MLNLILNKLGCSKINQQNQTRYCIFLNSLIIHSASFFVKSFKSKHWSEFHPFVVIRGKTKYYSTIKLLIPACLN